MPAAPEPLTTIWKGSGALSWHRPQQQFFGTNPLSMAFRQGAGSAFTGVRQFSPKNDDFAEVASAFMRVSARFQKFGVVSFEAKSTVADGILAADAVAICFMALIMNRIMCLR